MHPSLGLFYAFSVILVIAAMGVITVRNPVHAVMMLVLCFVSSAVLWILVDAYFLGVGLILVYVGAVMVLFLFVVMMLDINVDTLRGGFARYLPVGVVVGAIAVAEIIAVVAGGSFAGARYHNAAAGAGYNNIKAIGAQLYTHYVYPFELASVILLVAIISAIALTHRRRGRRHYQDPGAQSRVRRAERVRLVSMKSEERS